MSFYMALMYVGEMMTKLVTLGLVSAIEDDRDRSRYCQLYRLVRADGLGEWSRVLEEATSGPSSQHLCEMARTEQREPTQKLGPGAWQCEAVCMLDRCLRNLDKGREGSPFKVEGRRWFLLFSELRNRTRGHGAFSGSLCATIAPELEQSLLLFFRNFSLFRRDWVYYYYSSDSAGFIFGASLGDPLCDAILELLRGKPEGATRTEISEHFDRNKTKAQLDAALAALQSKGMIRSSQRATGGRAAEVWRLVAI